MKKRLATASALILVGALLLIAWNNGWHFIIADLLRAPQRCPAIADEAESPGWSLSADKARADCVDFSPCGSWLAVSGPDLRILDAADGKRRLSHNSPGGAALFSPDGNFIASALGEKEVEIWDAHSGETVQRLKVPVIEGIDIAPDLRHIITVDRGIHPLVGAFSPDGWLLAAEAGDKMLLYDRGTGTLRRSFDLLSDKIGELPPVRHMVATLTNRVLATAYWSGTIQLWDLRTGEKLRQLEGTWDPIASLSFAPDGRTLASCTCEFKGPRSGPATGEWNGEAIFLWDMLTGRRLLAIQRRPRVIVYPFEQHNPAGIAEKQSDPKPSANDSEGHSANVRSVVFSPDGRSLISGSEDKTIRMWEVVTGKQLFRWDVDAKVEQIAVSPDGRRIAAVFDDGALSCFPMDPRPDKAAVVDDKAFEQLWSDLGGEDGAQAYRAIRTLSQAGGAIPARIGERLKPAPGIAQWIADLDNDDFNQREAASKQLAAFGAQAEPALRKALAETHSAEVRSRINVLLKTIGEWVVTDPDALRSLRAIWVLERIGTPAARTVLEDLAKGATEARQTQEAKNALDFLDKRAAAVKP